MDKRKKISIEEFKRRQNEVRLLNKPLRDFIQKRYVTIEGIQYLSGIQGPAGPQGIQGTSTSSGPSGISGNFDGGEPGTTSGETVIIDLGEI